MSRTATGKVSIYVEVSPEPRANLDTLAQKLSVRRNRAFEFAVHVASQRQQLDPTILRRIEIKIDQLLEEL